MHTGYYLDLESIRRDDSESDFGFLENEFAGTTISAAEFLHGYCNSFACELSKVFGYKIEELRDFENRLVHAYCIGNIDGNLAYIDIRGITTDAVEFFEEFCDDVNVSNGRIDETQFEDGWLRVSRYSDAESYLSQHSRLDPGSLLELGDSAKAFISDNYNFYNLNVLHKKASLDEKIQSVVLNTTQNHSSNNNRRLR